MMIGENGTESSLEITENQISFDCMYYEIIKVIEINEIIAYIKWISQLFSELIYTVSLELLVF